MTHPSRATLPRSSILRGYKVFSRIFSEGDGFRRGQIVARFSVKPGAGNVVVGFVVRRAAGSAVRRNRLRRLVREAYRLHRQRFESTVPDHVDLELILNWAGNGQQALRPDFAEFTTDIEAVLRKLTRILEAQAHEWADKR